jgi:hypothetical protein
LPILRIARFPRRNASARSAAQRAGYSKDPDASRAVAARLLAQPDVAADITASMRAVLDRAEYSLERWLTEVWKMALADNTEVFNRDGSLKPFDEWPIESRRGLQGLDAEEIFEYEDGEKRQIGVLRKPRFVPKPPWFEMLGKFYNVLNRNADRAGENGGQVTILQLLQVLGPLPKGTTKERRAALSDGISDAEASGP